MSVVCSGKMGYHVIEKKGGGHSRLLSKHDRLQVVAEFRPGFIGDLKELQKALTLASALFRGKLSSLSVELHKQVAEACCHAHLERWSHKQMSHNRSPEHPWLQIQSGQLGGAVRGDTGMYR